MYILKHIRWSILAALIISGGMIGGAAAFAQDATTTASTQASAGITFPIAELGGCTDKASCKAYCDATEHMTECVAFAQAHGLMNKEEGARAKKFASSVAAGEGPGKCTSPGTCKTYCEDVAHVDECVAFAEKHDFKGQSYEHGKKVGLFLKAGGKMPGGCTSRASCEEYCSNLSHGEECFAFTAKAGIASSSPALGNEGGGGAEDHQPTLAQLQKLQSLAAAGETPGGCKTKDECMQYCRGDGHRDECVAFAQKAGFLNKNEAEHAKNFHGGPGGCNSQESCHAFCNDTANHDECFRFAQENGLMTSGEVKQTKDGWLRMREGLSNAPKEVVDCLSTTLGTSTIEDIESGKFVPGSDTGDKARACFEKFGGHNDPKKVLSDAPPQVTACLKEKLGADFESIRSGTTPPTPAMADSFRMCFQQMEMNKGASGQGGEGKPGGMPDPEKLKMYLRSAPPEVSACLKDKLGDQFDKLLSGEVAPTPALGQTMRSCFEQFRPQGSIQGKMMGGTPPTQGGDIVNHMPPQVVACLKEKLGADNFTQMQNGQLTPDIEQSMRACFQMLGGTKGVFPQGASSTQMRPQMNTEMLNRLSPAIQSCLKEKLGEEKFAQLGTSGLTADLKVAMTACFQQFGNPMMPPPTSGLQQPNTGMSWLSRLPPTVQACIKAKVGDEAFATIGATMPTSALEPTIKGCFIQSGSFPGMTGGTPVMPPPPAGIMPPPNTGSPTDGGSQPPTGM